MHIKKFKKTERRGLPGGPNEMFTYVTGVFSTEGYKNNSPDVNNPFNIIPSGNISMKDVDFPVIGVDNLGNSEMMMPGGEYEFPGDMVLELPMAQEGGEDEPWYKKWCKRALDAALYKMNPLYTADDVLQASSIPANIVREAIEGIGGKGDGSFDWKNIIPDIRNTTILDDTEDQKSVSQVLGKEGSKGFVTDILTDPTTYLGAGIIRGVAKKTIPKVVKSTGNIIKTKGDDVVEMVEDLFGNQIKKSDAVRLNRIEDANVTNTTFSKPNPDGSMPYETF